MTSKEVKNEKITKPKSATKSPLKNKTAKKHLSDKKLDLNLQLTEFFENLEKTDASELNLGIESPKSKKTSDLDALRKIIFDKKAKVPKNIELDGLSSSNLLNIFLKSENDILISTICNLKNGNYLQEIGRAHV